jgi:tRNA wybutosine-synthesizing protein 1
MVFSCAGVQLYVSIDASNAAELKEIDRPLFKDFWQRFLDCIDILANKGQVFLRSSTALPFWDWGGLRGKGRGSRVEN